MLLALSLDHNIVHYGFLYPQLPGKRFPRADGLYVHSSLLTKL